MLKLSLFCLLAIALTQANSDISPALKHALKTKGTVNIMVTMREKTFPVLDKLKNRGYPDRSARLNTVVGSLKALASESQKSVLAYLNTKRDIKVKSLWISNKISIKGADEDIIEALVGMPEVDTVQEQRIIPWKRPTPSKSKKRPGTPRELQWGIERVEAPGAWALGYTGQGVTIGTIDTGVRYTHKNLYRQWRHEFGWFDPYSGTERPVDVDGHGSHTMGTIIGSDGIGVAPDALWIACLGCESFGCTDDALEQCGQFITCPTSPDGSEENCDMAPHLVSNSWGGGPGDLFYTAVVAAWRAAGIIPVFAQGNSGSSCGSASSPGDYDNVIGVGATDEAEELAYFSSVGPTTDGRIKPDVSAPGVDVYSASNGNDEAFESLDGTSMATPHVAGAIALLLSNGTELNYDGVNELLIAGAQQTVAETGANCGDIPESEYPNNHVGWGRISVVASIGKLNRRKLNY